MNSKQSTYSVLFFCASKLAGFLKLSFMVGSYAAFFSGANCIVPLSGAFGGIAGSTILFMLSICVRMILYGGLFPLSYLVHVIPGLCAGYYWASRSAFIHLVIPILCMVLFVLHPVGGIAWVYALYWLIPIFLYFLNADHLFLTALGSTYIAHAVGSVMWLYMVPMDAAIWQALIPVVLIERLLFAGGMVVMHKGISWVMNSSWLMSKKRISAA